MIVTLTPPPGATHLVGDATDWMKAPLPVLQAPASLEYPDDAWVELAWLDAAGRMVPDPTLPLQAGNPWFPTARAIAGPRYRPDPLLAAIDHAPAGKVTRLKLRSTALGQDRRLMLWSPAGLEDATLPLLVVGDGVATRYLARLDRILATLIERGEARPAHVLFVEPVNRDVEYRFHDPYRAFVIDEALPLVEAHRRTTGERIALGCSLGGLVSAWMAWTRPDVFQAVVALSGAFLIGPGDDPSDPFHGSEWLVHQVRSTPPKPLRWALDCGTLEWLTPVNRRLHAALSRAGYDVLYGERTSGHSWTTWKNALPGLLRRTLAPGLTANPLPPSTDPR